MPGSRPCRRTHRPGAAGAFTLVELVTAASLMTVMMLGVVQIFAIITKTAGDAEGLQYAMEQGRAFFDTLHHDVQGLTREGYVRIVKGYVLQPTMTLPTTTQPAATIAWYGTDTLAMTSVGVWSGVWTQPQPIAPAAETIYTRNVWTPSAILRVTTPSDTSTVSNLDNRCGILGRGQWLIAPPSGGISYPAADSGTFADYSRAPEICALFNKTGDWSYPKKYLTVWPVTAASGKSDQPPSLQRIMACRVSEFYVEWLLYIPEKFDYDWITKPSTVDCRPGNSVAVGCPRAIRVTIAIHDPDDRKPLPPLTSEPLGRFRGYAMQEIFWIGDP